MKALRLHGPSDLRLEDLPVPQAPAGGLLVKVEACAICGSDVRNVRAGGSSHGMELPITLGHEMAGTIHEVGAGVDGYQVGQKVVLATIIPCGRCRYCLRGIQNQCDHKEALSYEYDGGFAEYIAVPPGSLVSGGILPMPEGLSFAAASITEPFSCALNGIELSQVGLGDVVVIIGAGPIGLMQCLLAKAKGAGKVILVEVNANRLALSQDFEEIDVRINAAECDPVQAVLDETQGAGADAILVAAPSGEAQVQAIAMAAKRGHVNLFGGLPKGKSLTTFDSNVIHYRELFVHGTSDSTIPQMMTILNLMVSGAVDPKKIISAVRPMSDYKAAWELASGGTALKVILEPQK